jgi:predicted MFS family arabinose efflux permease
VTTSNDTPPVSQDSAPASAQDASARPGSAGLALAVLFVIALFNYVDRTIVSILQEPIKRDLGLADWQLGALTGLSFALLYTTLALPIARLADRITRKYVLATALAVWSGMTALSGLATSFTALLVLRMGVAAGEAGCVPASHSILADYYPPHRRATALAIWNLSNPFGVMLGFAAGGWIAQVLGWREAFLIVGVSGVVMALLSLRLLKEPPRGRFDAVQSAQLLSMGDAIRTLWRLKAFRYLSIAGAMHAFTLFSTYSWNAPFYARAHQMEIGDVAMVLALLVGIGGGIGTFLGGYLSDRLGRVDVRWYLRVPGWASLLLAPVALIQYLAPDVRVSIAAGLVAAIMINVFLAPIVASAQLLVGARMRAFTSAALVLLVNVLGMGLGPLATGALSDVFVTYYGLPPESLRYAICACLVLCPVAAMAFFRAATLLKQELPAAAGSAESGAEHSRPLALSAAPAERAL